MIILGRKSEDSHSAIGVSFGVVRVGIPQKSCNGEFPTLHPYFGGFVDGIEDHRSTISWGYDDFRVIGCRARSCPRLQFSVKEHVEIFELFNGLQDFRHVQLMEIDEALDFSCRRWIVVFSTLLET